MVTYALSSAMWKLVEKVRRESGFDPSTATPERLQQLNSTPLNKRYRKLLGKFPRGIEGETFIIPVEGGVITGYLFRSRSHREVSDVTPLVVFYHGGGWVFGNMDLYNVFCARLADRLQATVLSVDYRLAPTYKFPTAAEDCYSTLLWASAGSRYWKVDPDQIFVMGDCVGGSLAAVVSRLARDRKGPAIAGQILICPVTDGRMRTESYETYKDSPTLTEKQMAFYINQYAKEPKDILNPNFSPMLGLDQSRLPETLVITAEYDPLKDDGALYAKQLRENDTPANCLEVKKTVHGFICYPDATGTEEALCAINQFISGRSVNQVTLITTKDYNAQLKQEQREAKRKLKNHLAIDSE